MPEEKINYLKKSDVEEMIFLSVEEKEKVIEILAEMESD